MNKIIVLSIFALSSYFLLESCGSSKLVASCSEANPTVNYASVKAIIGAKCTKCHGKFSTYAGLKKHLDNGSFEKHVLIKQSMPKGETLMQEEINLIMCWKNGGFKN